MSFLLAISPIFTSPCIQAFIFSSYPTCFPAGSCFTFATCGILRCTQLHFTLYTTGTIPMAQKSSTTQAPILIFLGMEIVTLILHSYDAIPFLGTSWTCTESTEVNMHLTAYNYTISELSPSLRLVLPFGSNWSCPGPALTLFLLHPHQSICKDLLDLSLSPAILLYIDIYIARQQGLELLVRQLWSTFTLQHFTII